MKNFFKFIALALSSLLISGCLSGKGSGVIMYEPPEKILEKWDSRFARGRVDSVMSKEFHDAWIDSYNDDEFYLLGMGAYSREELRNDFRLASIRYDTTLFHDRRVLVFFRKELDLQFHDIVDYYTGKYNREALLAGKPTHFLPRHGFIGGGTGGFQYKVGDVHLVHRVKPIMVLDVVCRSADPDCDWDDRPGTEIGLGRKVNGPEEYRGVKGESQQKIWKNTFP